MENAPTFVSVDRKRFFAMGVPSHRVEVENRGRSKLLRVNLGGSEESPQIYINATKLQVT